ncbi:MAG TPA: hypothetical protein VHT91_25010 [Kofleriaceae bacterium]|jgi:hypothetical protein|nr:hypothetical protein [Kofleriaceae bacterium]
MYNIPGDNPFAGVSGARRDLVLRPPQPDSKRMPPVAVSITDPLGTKLIDDWIRSLTACP